VDLRDGALVDFKEGALVDFKEGAFDDFREEGLVELEPEPAPFLPDLSARSSNYITSLKKRA
jgi:hypothetical protein